MKRDIGEYTGDFLLRRGSQNRKGDFDILIFRMKGLITHKGLSRDSGLKKLWNSFFVFNIYFLFMNFYFF